MEDIKKHLKAKDGFPFGCLYNVALRNVLIQRSMNTTALFVTC